MQEPISVYVLVDFKNAEGAKTMQELRKSLRKLLVLMVISISVVLGITTSASAVEYKYSELPPPPGWEALEPTDINNSGAVVGRGSPHGTQKGFLYNAGVYTELLPPGRSEASASDINNSGAVVGYGWDSAADQTNVVTKGFLAEPMTTNTTTTTITNNTTTTIPNGTTTTTICAAEAIYGEQSEQIKLLRKYRDNVLNKTPEGQEIIKTYYKFSPTVTQLLKQSPLLRNKAKTLIDGMLPGIKKKVEESNKEP